MSISVKHVCTLKAIDADLHNETFWKIPQYSSLLV